MENGKNKAGNNIKNTLSFTEDEVFLEISKYKNIAQRKFKLTQKQVEFIKKCREGICPVSFVNMVKLWNKVNGWDKMNHTTLIRITKGLEKYKYDLKKYIDAK